MHNLKIHNAEPLSRVNLWYAALRCLSVAMIVVYLTWQIYWLSRWQLPPALFLAITGLPAPTTGGTRSLICLLQGDLSGSLHNNAMAIPIAIMAISCAIWAISQAILGRRVRLSRSTGIAWVIVLALAWSIKMLQAAV